jgi:protocatechuate 3,4-dioxygenase beta subunit
MHRVGRLIRGQRLAQNVNAGLGGTVTDASGAVIPGVAVTVTGMRRELKRAITNEAGAYQFPSLQSGKYRASAVLGFQIKNG